MHGDIRCRGTGVQLSSRSASQLWFPLLPPGLTRSLVVAIAATAAISVANAIFEETLWRWAVPAILIRSGVSPAGAITISSLAFGVAHFNGLPPGVLGVVLTCVFALLSFWLVRVSGSLLPSICVHAVIDMALIMPLSGYGI